MRLRYILLLLLFLLFKTAKSQDYVGAKTDNFNKKNFVITPEAASLYRHTAFPVNYSTGSVDIKIPLYELKCGSLILPIYLSYNSTGIKINEPVSWVGQNWTLNVEPQINIIQHGHEDSNNVYDPAKKLDYSVVAGMTSGNSRDFFPDEYLYTLLNKCGRYVYSPSENKYVTFPYDNIQISDKKIIDTDGTVFYFEGGVDMQYTPFSVVTCRRASKIVSANGKDEIAFAYGNDINVNIERSYDNITVLDDFHRINIMYHGGDGFSPYGIDEVELFHKKHPLDFHDVNYVIPNDEEQMYAPVVYKTFDKYTNSYQVDFTHIDMYGNNELYSDERLTSKAEYNPSLHVTRQLISQISCNYCTVNFITDSLKNNRRLKKIEIVDRNSKHVFKTIEFCYYDRPSWCERDFLKEIITYSNDYAEKEIIGLEYYDFGGIPDPGSRSVDMWGYLNSSGRPQYETMVPQMDLIVKKDTLLPTTYFKYEYDEGSETFVDKAASFITSLLFGSSNSPESYTAFSIYQVLDTMSIGSIQKRGSNEEYMKKGMLKSITMPNGVKDEFIFECHRARIKRGEDYFAGTSNFHIVDQLYSADPNVNDDIYQLGGLRIKEIITTDKDCKLQHRSFVYGANEDGIGKTRIIDGVNYFMRKQIKYYNRDESGHLVDGLSTYDKLNTSHVQCRSLCAEPIVSIDFPNGSSVMYDKVTEYNGTKESNAGKTIYGYSVFCQDAYTDGYLDILSDTYNTNYYLGQLESKLVYKNTSAGDSSYSLLSRDTYSYSMRKFPEYNIKGCNYVITAYADNDPAYLFGEYFQNFIDLTSCKCLLTGQSHYDYSGNTMVLTENSYMYSDSDACLSSSVMSRNERSVEERYYYPKDSASISPYKEMLSKNIISPVIKTEIIDNDKYLCQKADYKAFTNKNNAGFYEPVSISQKYSQTGQFENRLNYKYDDNANLVEQVENGIPIVYIWSYKGEYPVASISNCTYEQLKSFISKNKLDEINKSAEPTSSHWTLINNIRTRIKDGDLKSSSMGITTYTYNPLVGMTSQTDAKGLTIEYEYDSFGRLSHEYVKQPDGNRQLVKQYEYKYASQR